MQPVLNIEDIKQVEARLTDEGVSISELMHRAGSATAGETLRLGNVKVATVLCGGGNNGGDGWVAAQVMASRGVRVTVVTPVEPGDIAGDIPRLAAQGAVDVGVSVLVAPPRAQLETVLVDSDAVVDAMLGTGFRGAPRAPFDIWIDCVNRCAARVVSVDVPSGLSAQTGLATADYVEADLTVTMLALKPGLLSDQGRDACHSIVVAPLAEQTERLVREADPVAWRMDADDYVQVIEPASNAVDKFTRGSVLVVGGSSRFPGAAMLAAKAAARAGAGYVTLAVPAAIAPIVQTHMVEVPVVALPSSDEGTFSAKAADAVAELAEKRTCTLVGPGMRTTSGSVSVVSRLMAGDTPLVVDADGLNCLSRLTSNRIDEFPELLRRDAPLVLTPHRGELGRLVGVEDNPPASLTAALEAARRIVWSDGGSEICVVSKGSATACVSVDVALLPTPGPASLATAGSGDVLGGIIAALVARNEGIDYDDLPLLCALGCEIHGHAGAIAARRYGSRGVMAGDVVDAIGVAEDSFEDAAAGVAD